MKDYWFYILLAFGGHIFYLMKQQLENIKRKDKFNWQVFFLSEGMNIMAIFLLVYLGIQAPAEFMKMSPMSAIMIGVFGSTILSSLINTKQPKEITESQSVTTTFTKTAAPNDEQLSNK